MIEALVADSEEPYRSQLPSGPSFHCGLCESELAATRSSSSVSSDEMLELSSSTSADGIEPVSLPVATCDIAGRGLISTTFAADCAILTTALPL